MDYEKVTINKEKTGINIKQFITTSTYTYEELANMLGLNSPRVMYEWIKGKKMPSIENLLTLSKIFECTIEEIIITK